MDGRTNGRADGRMDGRTDGRTCNNIVLSRHDRQKIFMENISESSNWKKSSDGLQASSQELVPID